MSARQSSRGIVAAGLRKRLWRATRQNEHDRSVNRPASAADIYIIDFIIDIFLPFFMGIIICIIVVRQPCVPSLAIAEFTIARCWFISHFFGLSGIAPIIVVSFDMSEHISMCAEAGLNVKTAARTTDRNAAYFNRNFSVMGRPGMPTRDRVRLLA